MSDRRKPRSAPAASRSPGRAPAVSTKSSRLPAADDPVQSELCGLGDFVDFSTPQLQRIEGVGYGQQKPEDKETTFQRCRYFAGRNDFVREILALRLGIYNFGFKLVAQDKADKARLETWSKETKHARVRQSMARYVRESWREQFTTSNVIALWRTDSTAPLVLNPEKIKFTDHYGDEVLTITHLWNEKQIDAMKVSVETKARLKASKKIAIRHDDELFRFEVLRDEKLGEGLGWPDLMTVLLRCGEFESLEVRQNILAQSTRRVIEQHIIGHETRQGPQAGMSVNFINGNRIKGTKEQLEGKEGCVRLMTNFDQKLAWPGPEPMHYDGKKFETFYQRMMWWAMPLGHMLVARAFNPNLMQVLEIFALEARELMRTHLNFVINDVWGESRPSGLPCPVTVAWDNKVLKDARLLTQLIQNGLNSGPISQETFREAAAVPNEQEEERKQREAGLEKKITQPIYDGNHGAPKGKNGKPSGGKDES